MLLSSRFLTIEMFVDDFVRVIINRPHVSSHLSVPCRCVSTMAGIKFNSIYLILHDVPTERTTSKHSEFKWVLLEAIRLIECLLSSHRFTLTVVFDVCTSRIGCTRKMNCHRSSNYISRYVVCHIFAIWTVCLLLLLFRFKRNDRMNHGASLLFRSIFFFSKDQNRNKTRTKHRFLLAWNASHIQLFSCAWERPIHHR